MRFATRVRLAALLVCFLPSCASGPWPGVPSALEPPPEPALVYDPPADTPAPEAVVATGGQYREIPLRWDPVLIPGIAGYVVESSLAESGPFQARVALRDRGALAWVDRGDAGAPLDDGATRFYRLRTYAHDGRVSGVTSAVVEATTAPLPDPPTGFRVFSQQPRSVPLSWNASPDPIVAGYTVERSPSPDGPFVVIAELDGRHTTHLLDSGLGDLRVLHYRVSSRNLGGQRGAPTNALRAVTKPAPLPPIALHVTGQRLGAVSLAWDPNVETDLLHYRLQRWHGSAVPETITYVGAPQTHAEDPHVAAEERYSYTVVALDRDGLESRPSTPVEVESSGYDWHVSARAGEVRLSWNPRSDEGFVRSRVTRSGSLWREKTFVTLSPEVVDQDVAPGGSYRYQIVLERADGQRAPASRSIAVNVPRIGAGFVEIQAPTSRIRQPEGNPR